MQVRRARRRHGRLHVGQQERQPLELADGRPNCWRSWLYDDREVERRLGQPGRRGGDAEAAGVQRGQRDRHALPRLADHPAGVDERAVEAHLADRVAGEAHLALGRAERDAVGVGRDHQAGQALLGCVARADEGGVEVGVPARGRSTPWCPSRGTPSRPPRAWPGSDRGHVRAGLGLGQAVGAELVAAEHVRQQRRLLLSVPNCATRVAGQGVHGDPDGDAHPGRRDLLHHLQVDLVRLPATAELLGVRQGQQPGLARAARRCRGGTPPAASAAEASGASCSAQISRVRSMRSAPSSVGIRRSAGMPAMILQMVRQYRSVPSCDAVAAAGTIASWPARRRLDSSTCSTA